MAARHDSSSAALVPGCLGRLFPHTQDMRPQLPCVLAVGLLACQPGAPPNTSPPAAAPTREAAASTDSEATRQPVPEPPPSSPYGAFALDEEREVWGKLEGTPISELDYCGLGRPSSWGPMPEGHEFDDPERERAAYASELPWIKENISAHRSCVRKRRKRLRTLESSRSDEQELARAESSLAHAEQQLEGWRETLARYEARIAELDREIAKIEAEREAEGERLMRQYEAGICEREPCPPGTALPPRLR